ncbi:MAG: glycoside hydrolase family 31 protein [Sporolactobacillus sp.]|jgi:alpha-glucosidase|nr:glycoside hydrolase family 31 protein [Sporolactobacillus sp.]
MFGKIENCKRQGSRIVIGFVSGRIMVQVVTSSMIRFFTSFSGENYPSKAIENLEKISCDIDMRREAEAVVIATEKLTVRIHEDCKIDIYDKSGRVLCADYRGQAVPFVRRGAGEGLKLAAQEGHKLEVERNKLNFRVLKRMEPGMSFYGLGDKTGHLNKKGYRYRMWNTDDASPHVESMEAMYKSIPFFIALKQKQAFGIFFDNTFETVFDFGKENPDYYSFGATGGNADYYFIYGPSVKDVVGGYTYLTGRTPLPQLWTLGYQQCRWAYVPEKRLREVAAAFRSKAIPCDALYLDIDYMDGYRVFTWDHTKFPDPPGMLADLRGQGYKVVTIIDPGVKKDKGYAVYDEGLKNGYFVADKNNLPYVNQVWPGDALYPDFSNEKVRTWWAGKQRGLTDAGVAGVWNDMNEPASFNGPLPDDLLFHNDGRTTDHREMHNVYGHYMAKATYGGLSKATGKRPFVITRACFAGTQKYSTVWSGDNQSLWEHLRMSLPQLMNLGLSGFAFCGTDVGGFGWDCSAELLARWTQVGTFTPLFRNHSSIFTRDQEPWAFDEPTETICRNYIQLRYRLLPYLYDIMHEAEASGLPMIRPLFLHYQDDPKTYQINDEFLCGEQILVAPVVEQGARARLVYLPRGGRWVDYWTKKVYDGGQYIVRQAPLELCPLFIRAGSIVPLYPVQQYVGEKTIDTLTLAIYPPEAGHTCRYAHYQDDGESFAYRDGAFNQYKWAIRNDGKTLTIDVHQQHSGYRDGYKTFRYVIHHFPTIQVLADGTRLPFSRHGDTVEFVLPQADAKLIITQMSSE